MVSKRAEMGSNNDVVIIMGAKAETIGQFTELFEFKEKVVLPTLKILVFQLNIKLMKKR